jgi:hypothetical protein
MSKQPSTVRLISRSPGRIVEIYTRYLNLRISPESRGFAILPSILIYAEWE